MPRHANIENLKKPPLVGKRYKVPCVFGTIYNIGPHQIPPRWSPIIRPSHEDSKYTNARNSTIWKETSEGWTEVEETHFVADPTTPHHYHVDPRFAPESFYTTWEIENQSWHSTIGPESEVKFMTLECTREMPVQRLFTGFGPQFVADYQDKKLKCARCPHKGTNLASVPVENGVVTCPAHGLQFNKRNRKCLTKEKNDDT